MSEESSICLDNPNKIANIDTCKHEFCLDCIVKWSKVSNTCPLCQARFEKIEKTFALQVQTRKRKRENEIKVDHIDTRKTDPMITFRRIHEYYLMLRSRLPISGSSVDTPIDLTGDLGSARTNESLSQQLGDNTIRLRNRIVIMRM